MQINNGYERSGTRSRIREIKILGAFTLAIAVIATVVMDILIYPLCHFALTRTHSFNFLIRYGTLFILAAFILFLISRRIYRHRRNGLTWKAVILDLLKRPFSFLTVGLFIILLSGAMGGLLYALLYNNNRLLHNLFNR